MNKEFAIIVARRFAKGLGAAVLAFATQFLLGEIPFIVSSLPHWVDSPMLLMVLTAGILALEKHLQGFQK